MGDVFPPRSNASLRRLGPSGSSVMPGPVMKIDSSGEDDQLMSPALALPPPPAAPAPNRKRKKTDDAPASSGEGGTANGSGGGGEPRRLRRSHEACARCRAKKIKCDSLHPRCGSCAAAGVLCQQEDRHRNTFMPRGHMERLERQLSQCESLVRKFIPDFDLSKVDQILAREGITSVPPSPMAPPNSSYHPPSPIYPMSVMHVGPGGSSPTLPPSAQGGRYSYSNQANYYPPMDGSPVVAHPPPAYGPSSNYGPPQVAQAPQRPSSAQSISSVRGQDPKGRDMSNPTNVLRSFQVSSMITNDPSLSLASISSEDKEDLAIGLASGRETGLANSHSPRNKNNWIFRGFNRGHLPDPSVKLGPQSFNVYLPRDREFTQKIVDIYFDRLNYHRPVFEKTNFVRRLSALYDDSTNTPHDDPGFLLSVYLILALGTLAYLYAFPAAEAMFGTAPKRAVQSDGWPTHEEFFEQALVVKPELRVTTSSLQALILLQWYLYIERHQRTLWRLVGSMVRLAVELGLHHDPRRQGSTFSPEESELRINLWWIVMIHDRGTSVLLGRPLAIAQEDFDTPPPTVSTTVSEHFVDSKKLTDVQAEIINSLYRPAPQTTEVFTHHARRILLSMTNIAKRLPRGYAPYFEGTQEWSEERKARLSRDLTMDIGLTYLKYGIARLLLLRAMFTNRDIVDWVKFKALDDAIKTAHNVIIVHCQLINFPTIAFFTSPMPLHIAAMTILFGYISRNRLLPKAVSMEDVYSALGLIPHFRWRWERKDANGGAHPMMIALAKKAFPSWDEERRRMNIPYLMPEEDWNNEIHSRLGQGGSPPQEVPVAFAFENVPPGLFFPGPAWPEPPPDGWGSDEGTAPTSPTGGTPAPSGPPPPALPPPQPPQQQHLKPNGQTAYVTGPPGPTQGHLHPASTSRAGVGHSEPDEWRKILSNLPRGFSNPAKHQPETELQQLYMQEERDPVPNMHRFPQMPPVEKSFPRFSHMIPQYPPVPHHPSSGSAIYPRQPQPGPSHAHGR